MLNSDDKLVRDLNQIKREQLKVLETIEQIKEEADADAIADIEKIERGAWQTVLDIDEISKTRNEQLAAEIEINSIAFRQRPNLRQRPEKCGNLRV